MLILNLVKFEINTNIPAEGFIHTLNALASSHCPGSGISPQLNADGQEIWTDM